MKKKIEAVLMFSVAICAIGIVESGIVIHEPIAVGVSSLVGGIAIVIGIELTKD